MSLIRKHVAVLQAWACLALVLSVTASGGLSGVRSNQKSQVTGKKRTLVKV